MPWDGSGNYQYPPGTPGIPDQTIESVKYNTFIDDLLVNDLNVPRPIHRGGTAGATALEALTNLGGEKAQQVVTNYDSMTWLSGSFYSAAGATNAPVAGHRFIGMVVVQDANNIGIQAYDLDSNPVGAMYTKIKKDGVWQDGGAWGTGFVKKSGDTMTGALNISATGTALSLSVGKISATAKGHALGWASGVGVTDPAGVTTADANIILYGGTDNWAGIGTDTGGNMWFRTGLSGALKPAAYISSTNQALVLQGTDATSALVVSGGSNLAGKVTIGTLGATIGGANGNKTTPTIANTNIRLYDAGATNWAGIGSNTSGEIYFVTSNAGATSTKMYISNAGNVGIGNLAASYNLQVGTSGAAGTNVAGNTPLMVSNVSYTNLGIRNATSGVELQNFCHDTFGFIGTVSAHNLVIRAHNADGITIAPFRITMAMPIMIASAVGTGGLIVLNNTSPGTAQIDCFNTQMNFALKNGGAGWFWISNSTGQTGGTGQITCLSISPAGNVSCPGVFSTGSNISCGGVLYPKTSVSDFYLAGDPSQNVINFLANWYLVFTRATGLISWILGGGAAYIQFRQDGGFMTTGTSYKPGGGSWADSSDIRIKNVLGDYERGLNEITQLRPIYYTFKGNDTNEPPAYFSSDPQEIRAAPTEAPYPNSPHTGVATTQTKFAGLVAQDVEPVFPELVTQRDGYIDGEAVTDLRDIDTTPLIFAMINAIKTLNNRITALEG